MVRKPVRLPKKLLLALISTIFALGIAEGLARMMPPPAKGGGTIFAPGGRRVPLGEVIHFITRQHQFNESINEDLKGPHGYQQRGLKLRLGFENPPPRWDYFDAQGCIAIETNSLGFRDEEFTVEKQPGELRILALGDSFTWGQGVRLDLTWPQQLEARLAAERPGHVEVINAGFAAGPSVYSPDGYDRWLESDGVRFDPDIVIVGFCLNDMGPVSTLSYPIVPLEPIAGGHSRLLDQVVRWWRQREVMAQPRDLAVAVEQQPQAWEASKVGLLHMRDLLATRGIPFVVAVFPMLSELEKDPYRRLHEMVAAFCQESGITSLDMRRHFAGQVEEDLWVHPTDQHPNHEGNRIIATGIHAFLKERGLLDR